jgi:hypothetical protein
MELETRYSYRRIKNRINSCTIAAYRLIMHVCLSGTIIGRELSSVRDLQQQDGLNRDGIAPGTTKNETLGAAS